MGLNLHHEFIKVDHVQVHHLPHSQLGVDQEAFLVALLRSRYDGPRGLNESSCVNLGKPMQEEGTGVVADPKVRVSDEGLCVAGALEQGMVVPIFLGLGAREDQ